MKAPSREPADKSALRRHYRQLRRLRLPQVGMSIRWQVKQLLLNWPGMGYLGLYWPLADELDLRSLVPDLVERRPELGERLALPAVSQGRLVYRHWHLQGAMAPDDCGIQAPTETARLLQAIDVDLLLIPALAIDQAGIRLGYGGGWYDRLRSEPAWRRVPTLAVLPQACLTGALPQDPWDIPLDGWVHEDHCHRL